jgi:hypothetical protein
MGTVEDFFNFDMLSGGASSSRSSSRSPSASYWNAPQTPPSTSMDTIPEVHEESTSDTFYTGLYGSPIKPSDDLYSIFEGTTMPMPIATAPELFGLASSTSTSPLTANSPETAISPSNLFVIDPSLMSISSQSTTLKTEVSPPHLSSAEEGDISAHEDDDDGESVDSSILAPKVGGKGSHRKGTVVSGGVRKNNGAVMTQAVRRDDEPLDDDDWRPTPEEYKKMSSKEKRQLRNKISARNFRVRRKGTRFPALSDFKV